jgi:hypothetical protein
MAWFNNKVNCHTPASAYKTIIIGTRKTIKARYSIDPAKSSKAFMMWCFRKAIQKGNWIRTSNLSQEDGEVRYLLGQLNKELCCMKIKNILQSGVNPFRSGSVAVWFFGRQLQVSGKWCRVKKAEPRKRGFLVLFATLIA